MQGTDSGKEAMLAAGLARIKERFITSLDERIDGFYELLEQLEDPAISDNICVEIRAQAHKLHGIAGSVGFPRMGSLAAQLEHHIDSLVAGSRPYKIHFVAELLNALLDEMERCLDAS